MSARKRKRLNHDDRANILSYLLLGYSVPHIAKRMGWVPFTIDREIVSVTYENKDYFILQRKCVL